jgi:hypothetical protein
MIGLFLNYNFWVVKVGEKSLLFLLEKLEIYTFFEFKLFTTHKNYLHDLSPRRYYRNKKLLPYTP